MRTKKYAASVSVSVGVMFYGRNHLYYCRVLMTSNRELLDLLEQVARGEVETAAAHSQLLEALRARPYEDLGFARVDHHRSLRQGFPEVVLGLGKTPAQIAAIAAEIAGRGSTLLITRASEAAYEAVRVYVPEAAYYRDAGSG